MREQVQTFATALLDHARTSAELDTILNYDPTGEATGDRTLERLKLAIKYKQKKVGSFHPAMIITLIIQEFLF
jgi:transient receptor potential cation channel subfamily C